MQIQASATVTTAEPHTLPEPSFTTMSETLNQLVHVSPTALEIPGQMETSSVAENKHDRALTHKKRPAPSSDHDQDAKVAIAKCEDGFEGAEVIRSAKRAKRSSPTKTSRISKKNKMTSNNEKDHGNDNVEPVVQPARPNRAREASKSSSKDESDNDGTNAGAENAADSEVEDSEAGGAKKKYRKKNGGKKKPNRVFSHAKAQSEAGAKAKAKGKKVAQSGDSARLEVFGAMMEKYWERARRTGKYVGAHISMAGGVENSVTNAVHVGGTSFALFLKNQRRWDSGPYPDGASDRFKNACAAAGFDPLKHVLPHGSYLINLCTSDKAMRDKGYESLLDDLRRCEMLGIGRYNFHPGSTKNGCTEEQGVANLVECLNRALNETTFVTIVIENMAGQGAVMGKTFEQLKAMVDGIKDKSRIGICLDTCHLWAAGFDISTKAGYEKVMKDFGDIVGFQFLKAIHINDCKEGLANKLDRHENIGKGKMGLEAFRCLMNDSRMNDIPMVLETPTGDDESGKVWKDEIELLYSLLEGEPALSK
ncbi:hypothetical protein SeMB42_g00141 [Synchytrium endobioticum]|uniref:Apurinic-apyrimidinic endonuclease 1 n=1 Tax=Synchytrium endobioticum TaxID=286115 RepID=A0A507DSE4_9FUNG|nr:hypothetical protein SeLEV6574_g01099 [Synchytrium endobioticum]TPX54664.1 hypothetical protein SeMB42_g00141 [Synchytrium endobioticum]